MNTARPGRTAAIYAGSFLVVGAVLGFIGGMSGFVAIVIGITFVYDLVTGFIFFWLIDRYHGNSFAFFSIIILGIAASIAIRFAVSYGLRS